MLKLNKADFSAEASEVHSVLVDSAKAPDMPGLGALGPRRVLVHISPKLKGPLTLVLGGHDSILWDLQNVKLPQVTKVIAAGYQQQYLTGVPDTCRVVTYRRDIISGISADYDEDNTVYIADAVQRLTGKKPASLQILSQVAFCSGWPAWKGVLKAPAACALQCAVELEPIADSMRTIALGTDAGSRHGSREFSVKSRPAAPVNVGLGLPPNRRLPIMPAYFQGHTAVVAQLRRGHKLPADRDD